MDKREVEKGGGRRRRRRRDIVQQREHDNSIEQIARADVGGVVSLRWEGGAPKPCQVLWIRPGPT